MKSYYKPEKKMETYITESPEETEKLGFALAKKLKGGETIAYRGGLGAGKTCFTRGVAALIQMSELSVCAALRGA